MIEVFLQLHDPRKCVCYRTHQQNVKSSEDAVQHSELLGFRTLKLRLALSKGPNRGAPPAA
jgi:hypothetical protein